MAQLSVHGVFFFCRSFAVIRSSLVWYKRSSAIWLLQVNFDAFELRFGKCRGAACV